MAFKLIWYDMIWYDIYIYKINPKVIPESLSKDPKVYDFIIYQLAWQGIY